MKYFLDTYAMVEIIKGNKNYAKYLDEVFFTNILNLYELYYTLLKDYSKEEAMRYFLHFRGFVIGISDGYIFKASEFRLENKKTDISYADCLGYIMALENNMKFLTGDKEFRDKVNVEFVK